VAPASRASGHGFGAPRPNTPMTRSWAQPTWPSTWTDSGALTFTSRWDEPLYPNTVSALMSKLISNYNEAATSPAQALPHARLHDLRHPHATTLLLAGVPVHVVAAQLGHADPAVTSRVYHMCCASTPSAGDAFAQAVKASVSNPLANHASRNEAPSVCAGQSGQGRGRTAGLPLFRRIPGVAACGWMWPGGRSSCGNHGSLSPDVA
jgi:hypothetical protein